MALGIYANGGTISDARRSFGTEIGSALSVGQTFSFDMDNGSVNTSQAVGISLENSNSETLFEFFFQGGDTYYETNDAAGIDATTTNFTRDGLNLQFTLTSATTYALDITTLVENETVTGTLMSPANGQVVSQIRLFNGNAGAGDDFNVYFNNFAVSAIPEASSFACLGLVALVLGGVRWWNGRS